MKFEVTLHIKTEEELDEAVLEMYVASQVMAGPIQCEVVACDAQEIKNDQSNTR